MFYSAHVYSALIPGQPNDKQNSSAFSDGPGVPQYLRVYYIISYHIIL